MARVNEWKVKIERPVFGDYIDFYIFRHIADGKVELLTRDSQGKQIIVSINTYETTSHLNSTLRLNGRESGEILKSLAEAIHSQGVSTDNDARMSGLLEATKEHLSDMRKLVFKS